MGMFRHTAIIVRDRLLYSRAPPLVYYSAAISSLLIGSAIYVCFRTRTLLMFRWFDVIGLNFPITMLRAYAKPLRPNLADWVLYSAPFALWVFSYLLFIRIIWANKSSLERHFWFWSVPLGSIGIEFGQGLRIVPGTFDINDLVTIVAGTLVALIFP